MAFRLSCISAKRLILLQLNIRPCWSKNGGNYKGMLLQYLLLLLIELYFSFIFICLFYNGCISISRYEI
jgi:hypothetical protein